MNRLGAMAVAVVLVLGGAWTVGFGTNERVEQECNDTDKCLPGPISLAGWMFVVAGSLAVLAGVGTVLVLRGTPP